MKNILREIARRIVERSGAGAPNRSSRYCVEHLVHDLAAPLEQIYVYSEALQRDVRLSPQSRHYAQRIEMTLNRMVATLDSLIVGPETIGRDCMNVNAALETAIRLAEKSQLSFRRNYSRACMIEADQGVVQAFITTLEFLANHSLWSTGDSMTVETKKIQSDSCFKPGQQVVTISMGHYRDKNRTEKSTLAKGKQSTKGGLGEMALLERAKEIITSNGGLLRVENYADGGIRMVVITFPLAAQGERY
jgi:light-regulated signal transduction histidine kinase (bacteriophytochrome)